MNKDTILGVVGVAGLVGLVAGVCVIETKEAQRVTDYKNSKRSSLEYIDFYLNKLSADDGYTARYCYDYYRNKFNAASTITEIDNAVYYVNRVVSLVKNGSTSSMIDLRIMKDRIDEEKEQKKLEEERRRQQQMQRQQQKMMKEFAEALNNNK